jgi:two-component system, OmpR family, manganese sensing response regulator
MAKILLVEDDIELAQIISRWLKNEGHLCEHVADGGDAIDRLKAFAYELVILDWSLPDVQGIEVLNVHRQQGGRTPVLMLTGKTSIDDKIQGFDAGADDYLTKPFNGKELTARIRALLRRPPELQEEKLVVGDLELIPERHSVKRADKEISLVPREYALLSFLMKHPNQLFQPDKLLDMVWSSDTDSSYEALTTCIKRLRKKIDRENEPTVIKNVHSVGYGLFVEPMGKKA